MLSAFPRALASFSASTRSKGSPSQGGPRASFRAQGAAKVRDTTPGQAWAHRHLGERTSPAHLGRKRSPFPGTGGWAPLGPLAETAAKPQRTRCSGKQGRELHFPAAFCSAAKLQARSGRRPRGPRPTPWTQPRLGQPERHRHPASRARRPPPPQTAVGQTGCFHSRVFHGLGPSGFLLLALAAAECSGKENVHLHPKWLPHLKPSLSPGLAQEPGSPKSCEGAQVAAEALPHPMGSMWGREPHPPGPPSQLSEDDGQ